MKFFFIKFHLVSLKYLEAIVDFNEENTIKVLF
jgi:hypothetical protein